MLAWVAFMLVSALSQNLVMYPTSGPVGSKFWYTVYSFQVNETVEMYFNGADQMVSCVGSNCSVSTTVPPNLGGSFSVSAQGSMGGSATSSFTITPSVSASPAAAKPGGSFTINGAGFYASDQSNVYFAGNNLGNLCQVDNTGVCSGSVSVPAGWTVANANLLQIVANMSIGNGSIFVVIPALKVSPNSGAVGASVAVTASNYTPGENVKVILNGLDTTKSCTTGKSGNCTVNLPVPVGTPGGLFLLAGQGNLSDTLSVNFTVSASVAYWPTKGVPGTAFTATMNGYVPGQNIVVTFPSIGVAGSCTSNATGSCIAYCTVPSTPKPCEFIALLTSKGDNNLTASGYFEVLPSSAGRASFALAALFVSLLFA
jgi:hypothetical protein